MSKQYKIVAFYDSETNNIEDLETGYKAFPILHQLGTINCSLSEITPENVKDKVAIKMVRHTFEACNLLDELPAAYPEIVPVVCIHNLGFDMYPLSSWLSTKEVKVLAKSATKPISFTILDEAGEAQLVLWDTSQFSQKSLARMGQDCGMPKLVGNWDYNLQRTPETELTIKEIDYAKYDIYSLAAWLGYWCRNNPEIDEAMLGLNVVTATGIVRAKRTILFDGIKSENNKYNIGRFWHYHNKKEAPKTDEELFTMQACTRGGFTFTASKCASIPYDLDDSETVAGYDATSMHPSQMVSHAYPYQFEEASLKTLQYAAIIIKNTSIKQILNHWYKPFPIAFNACFTFKNIRPKENTLYSENGIFPLAWARISEVKEKINEDNEAQDRFLNAIHDLGYKDTAINPRYEFGKLVSADETTLWLTELAFWEVTQAYDYDEVIPISGYVTFKFCKPTDMSIISVMHFYKAKAVFKAALHEYENTNTISNAEELAKYAPIGLVNEMVAGAASMNDVKLQNLVTKSWLNSLFGIECTNEYRDYTILTEYGIGYKGDLGLNNAPKNPKSWYQFGQRIVGWSRIMQHIAMNLIYPYVNNIICGDTDSIKLYLNKNNINLINEALQPINTAIDKGKKACCRRVENNYPEFYDELKSIGYYVKEFEVQQFCVAWNKAYVLKDDKGYHFTLAGFTTNRRHTFADGREYHNSYNDLAQWLEDNKAYSFSRICNELLGYNVQIDSSITKINGRKIPEWTSVITGNYTDVYGNTYLVSEPAALALYNEPKFTSAIDNKENAINLEIALKNNQDISTDYVIIRWIADKLPQRIFL